MGENVCRFLQPSGSQDELHVINFVLETEPEQVRTNSVYRMCLVCGGTGTLQTSRQFFPLTPGDLFLTSPASSGLRIGGEGLQFYYISFLGRRANALMEQMEAAERCRLFPGFDALLPVWESGLRSPQAVIRLRSEGILLYTFAELGQRLLCREDAGPSRDETAQLVKQYVDDHSGDPDLTLEKVGQACGYHPKYLSGLFKATFKIGFSDYLNTVRIQQACTLMEQGFTSVKTVATLCGYRDPLYFSKVFRSRLGLSPRQQMQALAEKRQGQ